MRWQTVAYCAGYLPGFGGSFGVAAVCRPSLAAVAVMGLFVGSVYHAVSHAAGWPSPAWWEARIRGRR